MASLYSVYKDLLNGLEHNLTFQEPLYKLRSDTKDAFDEAKRLEARWKEVEREQREVYQVRVYLFRVVMCETDRAAAAIYTSIPPNASEARHNSTR